MTSEFGQLVDDRVDALAITRARERLGEPARNRRRRAEGTFRWTRRSRLP
jgi:hypothetical protein